MSAPTSSVMWNCHWAVAVCGITSPSPWHLDGDMWLVVANGMSVGMKCVPLCVYLLWIDLSFLNVLRFHTNHPVNMSSNFPQVYGGAIHMWHYANLTKYVPLEPKQLGTGCVFSNLSCPLLLARLQWFQGHFYLKSGEKGVDCWSLILMQMNWRLN